MVEPFWPRPMAVMASTALRPVCIGSLTGWRWTTEGAWSSRARVPSFSIGPWPSMGWPSGSTTRPRKPSPTGTERISPVRRTAWPSSMSEPSPRSTAPISRTSRFSAMPRRPFSNSRSSLVMAECRPSTRAMPSPVSETRPTSSRAASGVKPATLRSIASRISSGRIVSSVISSPRCLAPCGALVLRSVSVGTAGRAVELYLREQLADHAAAGLLQAVCGGAVDDLVADAHRDAADDVGIDRGLDVDLSTVDTGERRREPGLLLRAQRHGRGDLGREVLAPDGGDLDELVDRVLDRAAARRGDDVVDQGAGLGLRAALEQRVGDRDLAVGRHRGVGQGEEQLAAAGHRAAEPEQLVLDGVDPTVALGHGEQRLRGELVDGVDEVTGARPALADDRLEDLDGQGRDPAAEDLVDHAGADRQRSAAVGQRGAQRRLTTEQRGRLEQLTADGAERRIAGAA